MPRDLDTRIGNAFTSDAKSEDFEPLIRDAEFAAKTASEMAAQARERALDPTITPVEVAAARSEMEDAQFRSDRLNVAVKKLGERHRVVKAAEENARRTIAYNEVIAARDKLAGELRETYPKLVTQITDLLQRVESNDREVAAINAKLPDAAERILGSELIARNLKGYTGMAGTPPCLVQETRLPAFVFDVHQPYAWPIDERLRHASVIPISIRA